MKAELDVTKTVKKSNILNELRNANASLIEYRLFCVYLSHISMNSDDNVVKFSLSDYAKIAGLDRPRYLDLKAQAENLVGMTASLANEDGGFSVYSIFSEFKLFKENDQWMVSLECNSKIAPMIREQKGRFLRYKLYNTIYLRSYNQQRMYELLKQYEKIGARAIDLPDLRAYLSIRDDEYPLWYTFSRDVLKVAQKALKENTDIYFEYTPVKKGKKVIAVRFDIFKNHEFIDQLRIDEFLLETENEDVYEGEELDVRSDEKEYEQISVFEMLEDEEEQRERERDQANIELFRSFLQYNGKEFSDNQIREQREATRSSAFADSLHFKVMANELDTALSKYVKAQELYARSNCKTSLHGLFVRALREDYAEFYRPEEQQGSFDTDDFYNAAVNRKK